MNQKDGQCSSTAMQHGLENKVQVKTEIESLIEMLSLT